MRVTSTLTNSLTPTAVALGNFDGIHQGHRQVIQPILKSLDRPNPPPYTTVVTFHPHPQEFFTGQPRSLLTPLEEKVAQLQILGVDQLVMLPFDRELASLTPEHFVAEILVKGLQAKQISVGQDFCFGRHRTGTAQDLCMIAAEYGIDVTIAPLKLLDGHRISSSAIRAALQQGDIQQANYLLGRPYSLIGEVVQGQQVGRKLGFPTANLKFPPEKFLPRLGVYAVWANLCDRINGVLTESNAGIPGVMNLGYRPTVDGNCLVAEVHLFDWSADLYGKTLSVHFSQFIRPEQKFTALDELKVQIQSDCLAAKAVLSNFNHP
ncbi:bifunctional riboflavin kinase/FAD synthetase [Leptodesmis sp.]|uniref:bifunctional riboflavin kinase/FAD synthetase n=1 Tax=Leptodesmis sp. TaxID=3100501 RepID=UPI004053491C